MPLETIAVLVVAGLLSCIGFVFYRRARAVPLIESSTPPPNKRSKEQRLAKAIGSPRLSDGSYKTDPMTLGDVQARARFDETNRGSDDYPVWASELVLKTRCPNIPEWLKLSSNATSSRLVLGEDVFDDLGPQDLEGLLSTQAHESILYVADSKQRADSTLGFRNTIQNKMSASKGPLIQGAKEYIQALHELDSNAPRTRDELDERFLRNNAHAGLLHCVFKRLVEQEDERAGALVHEGVACVPASALLDVLEMLPQGALDDVIERADWDSERALECLGGLHQRGARVAASHRALRTKALDTVRTMPVGLEQLKRHPHAVLPVMIHFWHDPARRTQCLTLGDAMISVMPQRDALAWIDHLIALSPQDCTYDRVGLLLKQRIAPGNKPKLAAQLLALARRDSALFEDPHWVKRALRLLRFANLEQSQALSAMMTGHVPPALYTELRNIQTEASLSKHPIQHAVRVLLDDLESRRHAHAGSLSLSEASPDGALSLTGDGGIEVVDDSMH